jgi:hypothetical protein
MVPRLSVLLSTGLLPGVVWGEGMGVNAPFDPWPHCSAAAPLELRVSQLETVVPHFGRAAMAEWR